MVESEQNEPTYGELEETEIEELAETDQGEPEEGVTLKYEPEKLKGLGHTQKAGAKNLVESEQDEPSFEELEVTEKEAAISWQ